MSSLTEQQAIKVKSALAETEAFILKHFSRDPVIQDDQIRHLLSSYYSHRNKLLGMLA